MGDDGLLVCEAEEFQGQGFGAEQERVGEISAHRMRSASRGITKLVYSVETEMRTNHEKRGAIQ